MEQGERANGRRGLRMASRADLAGYFSSGCFFCISSVHGGVMSAKGTSATDCAKCSDAWRTINNRIPRRVFFPPNQSRLFSRSASFIPVIAYLAWTKDSFNVATTFALSAVDFSKPFTSNPAGGGVPTNLYRLKLAALTCIHTSAKERTSGEGRQIYFSAGIASASRVNLSSWIITSAMISER